MRILRALLGVSTVAVLLGTQPVLSAIAQNQPEQPQPWPTLRFLPGPDGQVRGQIVRPGEPPQILEANQFELVLSGNGLNVQATGPGTFHWAPSPRVPFTRYEIHMIPGAPGAVGNYIHFENKPGQK
jgi:hypothetical protein